MNDMREKALEADREGRMLDAAAAYEALVASDDAIRDDYLNLSVLYLEMVSSRYHNPAWLPDGMHGHIYGRSVAITFEAETRFGPHPETLFWQAYTNFILGFADDITEEACLEWVATGETLEPYLSLFGMLWTIGMQRASAYEPGARRLLEAVASGRTERERYVRSVLESVFQSYEYYQQHGLDGGPYQPPP